MRRCFLSVPHDVPVGVCGDHKAMALRNRCIVFVAIGCGQRGRVFFVVHVAHAFEEQQRKDVLLVVASISEPPKQRRRTPEVGFEFGLSEFGLGVVLSQRAQRSQR